MTACEGTATVRCIVVNSLGNWAQSWDELVGNAPVPTPFLRSWWLDAVRGRNAEFLLFLYDGALIGGLAIERRRRVLGVWVYRFCGSGPLCPDHLDLLAAPGWEAAVRRGLREWWTRPGSRVLDVDGLVEDSLLEATFGSAATTLMSVAPWGELPGDAANFLAARSSSIRKTLRQAQRRLAAAGITHRRLASADADTALRDFVRLQQDRGGRDALLGEMPRLAPAVVAGLAVDEVQIDVLESAEGTVAMWISFWIGGAVRAYQSARVLDHNTRDAGAVLLFDVVQRAVAEGCHELDLLRGSEAYKFRYVDQQREIKRLRLAHGRRGAAVLAVLTAATRARIAVGRARRAWRDQRADGFGVRTRRRTAA